MSDNISIEELLNDLKSNKNIALFHASLVELIHHPDAGFYNQSGMTLCSNEEVISVLDSLTRYGGQKSELAIAATMGMLDEDMVFDMPYSSANSEIEEAIRRRDHESIRSYIDAGISMNDYLWFAVSYSDVETLEILINAGADVNHLNSANSTAIFYAITGDDDDMVSALLAAGADHTIPSAISNYTPIQWAASSGSPKSTALLLEYGADAFELNDDGENAIQIAVRKRDGEINRLPNTGFENFIQPFIDTANILQGQLDQQKIR